MFHNCTLFPSNLALLFTVNLRFIHVAFINFIFVGTLESLQVVLFTVLEYVHCACTVLVSTSIKSKERPLG